MKIITTAILMLAATAAHAQVQPTGWRDGFVVQYVEGGKTKIVAAGGGALGPKIWTSDTNYGPKLVAAGYRGCTQYARQMAASYQPARCVPISWAFKPR